MLTMLERPHKTNLEEITHREASLSGCEILYKFEKTTSFFNFSGTTGRKRPVEMSPTKH
jgi:hypothetical protein